MDPLIQSAVQHLPGFLFAFIPGLINLGLFFYLLFYLPQNRLTNIFALLILSIFFWQIDDALCRISLTSRQADFWDSIFSPAWIFLGPLTLHFSLLYTELLYSRRSRLFLLALYAPAFVFLTLYQFPEYPHIFHYVAFWGWLNSHDHYWLDQILVFWLAILVLTASLILIRFSLRQKRDGLLKRQTALIAIGVTIPTLSGVLTQVLFPFLFHLPPISLTSFFLTFFTFSTILALKKFRLFHLSDLMTNEYLVEGLPVLVFSMTENRWITFLNHFGREKLGIRRSERPPFPSDYLLHFVSSEQEKKFYHSLDLALAGKEMADSEFTLLACGSEIDLIFSSSPIINNNQIEGALFVARDITELNKFHEQVRYRDAMLEEAQQLSHIGSWDWDILRDRVSWSDELFRIFGYQPGELDVSYSLFQTFVPAEDLGNLTSIVEKALADHQPFAFFHRIIRKDGTLAVVHQQGKVQVNEQGAAVRMTGSTQDVTELRKKEEILREQNLELQKINSELDRFVYSVSHDLRAPLTSMLGVVEISGEDTSDPLLLNHLSLLKASILKLDKFILDILNYSRNSRTEVRSEDINFKGLLEGIVQDLQNQYEFLHEVQLLIQVEQTIAFRSDRDRLGIILTNLISNGMLYRDPEKVQPFVDIRIEVNPEGGSIQVRDNGIGIRRELHHKIFEMFYRGVGSSRGSGLGLYIARETTERLNGTIGLESEPKQGSIFRVWIPNRLI